MSFENVDDDGRTTDACLYYKRTLWAFGSGELKTVLYSPFKKTEKAFLNTCTF